MNITITDIAYYLPPTTLSNNDLKDLFPDFDSLKFSEKIGIDERRISLDSETALDLGICAAKKILTNENKDSIDFILFCTQSPDYFLPTSACIIQDKLGLRKGIGALDFNLGCSGYVYGLALAKGLISSSIAKKVLFITAETYTKYIHPKNKSNRAIFGDGASATIITSGNCGEIGEFVLGTDGKDFDKLIIRNGGCRSPRMDNPEEVLIGRNDIVDNNHLYMDGPEIFNFTISKIPEIFQNVLIKNQMNVNDIDYIIFHQANKFMLEQLRKKINVDTSIFHNDLKYTGNTVSSTIPIALSDSLSAGKIKKGNKVLLLGFGVGLSWAGTIIKI
jgi:3-oxoacyl-[acyl-carrier-protein] synthase-3